MSENKFSHVAAHKKKKKKRLVSKFTSSTFIKKQHSAERETSLETKLHPVTYYQSTVSMTSRLGKVNIIMLLLGKSKVFTTHNITTDLNKSANMQTLTNEMFIRFKTDEREKLEQFKGNSPFSKENVTGTHPNHHAKGLLTSLQVCTR